MAQSINPVSYLAPQAAAGLNPQQPATPDRLVNKEVFLQLLVAQIKHQDPLNPADPTQFVTQLAQFTELEQMMSIRELLESAVYVPPSYEPQP